MLTQCEPCVYGLRTESEYMAGIIYIHKKNPLMLYCLALCFRIQRFSWKIKHIRGVNTLSKKCIIIKNVFFLFLYQVSQFYFRLVHVKCINSMKYVGCNVHCTWLKTFPVNDCSGLLVVLSPGRNQLLEKKRWLAVKCDPLAKNVGINPRGLWPIPTSVQ